MNSLSKEELESIESITRKLLGGDTNTILNESGDFSQLKSLEFILTNKDFFLENKENITSNTNNTAHTATVEVLKHVYASEFQNLSDNEISSFIKKLNSSIPLAAALSDIRPLTNNNLSSDQFTTCIRGFLSNKDATSLTQYFNKHKKEIMSTPDQEQQQTLSVK